MTGENFKISGILKAVQFREKSYNRVLNILTNHEV